jgi:hypothetical protein
LIALDGVCFAAWLSVAPPEAQPPEPQPTPASEPTPRSAAYADVLAPLPMERRDEVVAKRLMDSGKAAFRDERFDDAIELFAEAYRTFPQVTLLYALGSAHRRAYEIGGDVEHRRLSIRRYQQYLSEAPDGESADFAQNYLTSLLAERDLGLDDEVVTRILVATTAEDATMSVDGAPPLAAPGVISVEPGNHELRVTAPGYAEFVQRVDVPEGATYQVDAALIGLDGTLVVEGPKRAWVQLDGKMAGRLPLATPLRATPGAHVVTVSKNGFETLHIDVEIERDSWNSVRANLDQSNKRIASYFLFGLSTAGVVAGCVTLGFALGHQAKAAELDQQREDGQLSTLEYDRYLEYVDQRNNMRAASAISGLGGGLLLLTGLILFVNDNPRQTQRSAVARRWAPSVGPGQAGVVLRF